MHLNHLGSATTLLFPSILNSLRVHSQGGCSSWWLDAHNIFCLLTQQGTLFIHRKSLRGLHLLVMSSLLIRKSPPGPSSALPSVTGLLLYTSPLTSRMILAVSPLPSLFLCLWLLSACVPFQDRSSNPILLASFISLSSSFNISLHFVLEPRGFQVWNLTSSSNIYWKLAGNANFCAPLQTNWVPNSGGVAQPSGFDKPPRWFWCMLNFETHCSPIHLFSGLADIWIT